jgi:hypothetical protein
LNEYRPRAILTSSKVGSQLTNVLQNFGNLEIMKAGDYSFVSCRTRIVNLQLPFLKDALDSNERSLLLSSTIDLENEALVIATGSLILWLERRSSAEKDKNGIHHFFFVNVMRPLVLYDQNIISSIIILSYRNDIMILDNNALNSLQVSLVD